MSVLQTIIVWSWNICTVLVVPSIAYIAANPAISTFTIITTNWANGILIFILYRTFTTLSSLSLALAYLMRISSWYSFSLLLFLLLLFLGLTLLFFNFLLFRFFFSSSAACFFSSFSCRYFIICSPERWEGKADVPFLVLQPLAYRSNKSAWPSWEMTISSCQVRCSKPCLLPWTYTLPYLSRCSHFLIHSITWCGHGKLWNLWI